MSSGVRRGYVLAGGLSTRMGQDKAQMRVGGVAMAAVVADVLTEAGLEVWIVRRHDSPSGAFIGATGRVYPVCIEDNDHARHALWGIVTALEHARGGSVLVLPCDVPDLTGSDVQALLAAVAPAVVSDGERVHGLCAVVRAGELKRAREIAVGGGSVRSFVAGFTRVIVDGERLRNVNGPGDL
ncbi:MAG: NTP transferase domain-containing protein [Myxococcota bacterium]